MYNLIKDDVYTFYKPKNKFLMTPKKLQNNCSNQLKLSRGFVCTSFKLIVCIKPKNLGHDNFELRAFVSKFRLTFKILHLHVNNVQNSTGSSPAGIFMFKVSY